MKVRKIVAFVIALVTVLETAVIYAASAHDGDIDKNGIIDFSDAMIVLRYAAGHTVKTERKILDINGDGKINSADVLMILDMSVKSISGYKGNPAEIKYINSFTSLVNNSAVYKNMSAISGSIGSRWYKGSNVIKTCDYILSTLKSYGYSDSNIISDEFIGKEDTPLKNIYCKIPTSKSNADILVFCAHYDSADIGRGAVDNASGVCTVLEIARIMKSMRKDFGKEIRFCFFSGEEVGFYGAYRYMTYIKSGTSSADRHKFVLNIDMAAHHTSDKDWYLCVCTEPYTSTYSYRKAQRNYTSNTVDAAKKIVGDCGEYRYVSPVTSSEHDLVPFRRNDISGVTLSWRVVDSSRSGGNDMDLASPPLIHTSYDTIENTDMDSLYSTVRLVAAVAAEATF